MTSHPPAGTPSGIVLGKLLNTLGMFLLIVLSMLPLVATSYFLIGLDVSSFLVSVLILLSVAYSIASISILCSVLSQSVLRAMIRAFFCAAAAIGGAFFVSLSLVVISVEILEIVPRTYVPQNPARFIFIFAPFAAAVGHAVEPEMIPPSTWAWSIVVQLGIGTVCLVAAVYAVRRLALLPLHKAPQSFWRRLLGMLCDAMVVWLTSALAGVISNAWQLYVLAIPATDLNQSVTSAVTVAVPLVLTAALTLATGILASGTVAGCASAAPVAEYVTEGGGKTATQHRGGRSFGAVDDAIEGLRAIDQWYLRTLRVLYEDMREVAPLERKLRTEPQLNRKIELRRTLKMKQHELEQQR